MTEAVVHKRSSIKHMIALLLTEFGAPWMVNIAISVIMGWSANAPEWGIFVAVIAGIIPMSVTLYGMRKSRICDHHVTDGKERHLLMVVLLAIILGGLIIQIAGSAPIQMIALTAAGMAALIVAALITRVFQWKISIHTAVSAGAPVVLALALSPWWLLALGLTPLISWSRVHLKDQTKGQVVAGAITGAVTAGVTYALIA